MIVGRDFKENANYFSKAEKKEIVATLKKLIEAEKTILFSYIYGSFVDDVAVHDIDIGLYVKDIREEDATRFSLEFGEYLQKVIGFPVDVKIINNASIPFQYSVMRGDILTDQNPDLFAAHYEYIVSRYLDMKPLLMKSMREAFGNA